jgi:hypothetical protein
MATEEDEAPADLSPDDALAAGFRAALIAVIEDAEMDVPAKLAKLKTLLTTHDKLTADAAPAPEAEEEEEDTTEGEEEGDDEEEKPAKKDTPESRQLRREIARLKRGNQARALCEAAEITPTPGLLKTLSRCAGVGEMRDVIESMSAAANVRPPRSKAGNAGTGLGAKPINTVDDFVSAITN